VKATNLHHLLWDEGKTLRNRIFTKKTITVPTFQPDGREDYSYTELSLRSAIAKLLQRPPDQEWQNLLPCGSDVLVFREAYQEMLDIIIELEQEHGYMGEGERRTKRPRTHSSIILTGNPGIGKTWFQSAILVERLLAGIPTVLQMDNTLTNDELLLFDHRGVTSLHELPRNDPVYKDVEVWALADQKVRGALATLSEQQWLTIVTSSPNEGNYKQLQEASADLVWYMPTWNWSEIVAASGTQDMAMLKTLRDNFQKYGPVARLLLEDLYCTDQEEHDLRIKAYDLDLQEMIAEYVWSPTEGDQILFSQHESHDLVLLEPVVKAPRMYNSTSWVRRVITPTIAAELAKGALWYSEQKAYWLYRLLLGHPSTSTAAGWVFEARVHTVLSMGGASYEPRLISTQSTATLEIHVKSCPNNMAGTFDSRQLEYTFRRKRNSPKFERKLDSVYMRPLQQNLLAIDSLMVIMEGRSPRAILFQITIAENRPISGPALSKVWNALPKEVKEVDPAIVFVVPHDKAAGYKKQNIEGTTDGPATWPQFVLGLDDSVLWPSHADAH
jgi:hypothetical protein